MTQLDVFDELDAEQKRREEVFEAKLRAQREAEVVARRQPVQCSHCGEWSPNEYIWSINHRICDFWDMPGVCIKHYYTWSRARWDWAVDDRVWLALHGFEVPTELLNSNEEKRRVPAAGKGNK